MPPYILQVLCLAGINIILAVSLNLINGFTGQFSIGHAGFMAIGAYASAFVTVTFGRPHPRRVFASCPEFARDGVLLLIALAAGALLAAIAGFVVGVPSLRLRGDYLAIVTLGFGEIIRVFILNIDAVGGARGYSGIPKLANFFWIYGFAALTIVVVSRTVRLLLRTHADRDPRGRDRRRSDGRRHDAEQGHLLRAVFRDGGHRRRTLRPLPDVPPHELVHLHQVDRDHHHDRDRRSRLHHGLGPRRRSLHRADRGLARVLAIPDGALLAPPDRHHDRAAAGDPRPLRESSVAGVARRRAPPASGVRRAER